ncbi:MAG: TraB/GumN family protein [Erythrobacter sp.]|uniref:TraB/GumN family protein n=1 Tax=Erythrobacter sp. TaxID=1042 RepID=UPI0032EB6FD6
MKRISLLTACATAFALAAGAPAAAQDTAPPAADLPAGPDGPALWSVSDEDTTIYLFGTVHVLPEEVKWYDPEIASALAEADTLVTEIRMDPDSEAAMQQLAMAKGMLPEGTTLRSLLDEEQTATYEAALGKIGVPAAAFDRFEPWMAGLTLTTVPLMQQGYSPDSGVEKIILSKAGDKPRDALETAEFQLGLFDGLPTEQQVAFMMSAAEGVDEVKDMLDSMVAEWIEGDADALAEIMNDGMDDPALAEALLYRRNATWAEWIEARLAEPGTVFIAVGAGHLAGEKSVQDYLAEKGIATARIQ